MRRDEVRQIASFGHGDAGALPDAHTSATCDGFTQRRRVAKALLLPLLRLRWSFSVFGKAGVRDGSEGLTKRLGREHLHWMMTRLVFGIQSHPHPLESGHFCAPPTEWRVYSQDRQEPTEMVESG